MPNSLGPAELLTHYGTEAQKKRWLPALAAGTEIPCFALTEPGAGSDAGAINSSGVVFRGEDGRLWLRLSWNKRYITLAAVATVLGLAFQLHDPENLLGKGPNPGITCALVPTSTPGVVLGRRHDPMGVPFYNCPTSGRDVKAARAPDRRTAGQAPRSTRVSACCGCAPAPLASVCDPACDYAKCRLVTTGWYIGA